MAAYILGKILFHDAIGGYVKRLGICGIWTAFTACPCLSVCFDDLRRELLDVLSDSGKYKDLLVPASFTADPFGALLEDVRARHEDRHERLKKKYGIELGLNDEGVKKQLSAANKAYLLAAWDDWCVAFKWSWPAAANGLCWLCCCCLRDMTHYEAKLKTGEAHKAYHCSWCCGSCCGGGQFLGDPQPMPYKELAYGHHDELVIIMSAPGDHHAWPGIAPPPKSDNAPAYPTRNAGVFKSKPADGKSKPADGYLHTWFTEHAKKSEGTVVYCPIQMLEWKPTAEEKDRMEPPSLDKPPPDMTKWDEVKQRKWKHHVIKQTGDPTSKYFEQWTQEDEQRVKGKGKEAKGKEGEENGIDLWKAYWVANIKEELAKMHNNYSIRKITFVAILGGGEGSEFERKQLENMEKLFKGRRMMERFIDMAVKDVACCVTMGWLTPGYNSAIYWVQRIGAWLVFCSSSRQVPMDLKFVHPSDLHAYLERPYDPNIKLHSYPSKQLPPKISGYKETYVPGDQAVVENVIEPFLAKQEVEALNAVANKAEGVKAAALKALEEAEKAKAHKAVEEAQRAVNKAAAYALVTRDAAAKKTAEKRHLLKKAEAMEAEELAASSAQRMP